MEKQCCWGRVGANVLAWTGGNDVVASRIMGLLILTQPLYDLSVLVSSDELIRGAAELPIEGAE